MEHILQTLEKNYNNYNQTYNELIEKITDFEDKYELPIGINIITDETTLLYHGILTVTVSPTRTLIEAKYYYDTKIHPFIEKEMQLKLIKVEKTITYHNKGTYKKYKYYYTYENNFSFEKLAVEDSIM